MPHKDPSERRASVRESVRRHRAAKRAPQMLAQAVPVVPWAPTLGTTSLPLRTAADELAAYELGAEIALSCPDGEFSMWCARARLIVMCAQGAGRIRESAALTALDTRHDPTTSFEYAIAVASAALHDDQLATQCEDHRLAIAAGLKPPPLNLESGFDKYGLGDEKWRK